MAKKEECLQCKKAKQSGYGIRCSYFGRQPKYDEFECAHFDIDKNAIVKNGKTSSYKQCPNGHYYQGDYCPYCQPTPKLSHEILCQLMRTSLYNFEYKLIPIYVDILKRDIKDDFEVKLVDASYWQKDFEAMSWPQFVVWDDISCEIIGDMDTECIFLYEFPKPFDIPLAKYGAIYVNKQKQLYNYYTLEQSFNGYVLGSKTTDGHINFGHREDMSKDEFIKEICNVMKVDDISRLDWRLAKEKKLMDKSRYDSMGGSKGDIEYKQCSNGHYFKGNHCPYCNCPPKAPEPLSRPIGPDFTHPYVELLDDSFPPQIQGIRRLVGKLVNANNLDEEYNIYEGRNIIGRDMDCNITINDNKVSSRHAVLLYRVGKFSITDSQSSYGTFVNGNDIDLETCYLEDGDEIRVGDTTLLFKDLKCDK
jgi:hypothetical protein